VNESWNRVESLVAEALGRPPSERAAFVEQCCGDDLALLHDVVSLLAQETAAASFLEGPAVATLAPTLLGRRIGAYRIDARVGIGGMGVVYRAHDTVLDRDVAVKILTPAAALDADALARMGREARILAALNHPCIATIYGIEETGPVRALILELLDGETLADRLAREPLRCGDALRFAMQIADALAAAHDKGIVHRDLKPANIQITASGTVKLLDFGIAKTSAPAPADTTLVTAHGSVMGTSAYMSPEQTRGEVTDRSTDVWAFACVLFEMLSGTRAFERATPSDTVAAVLEHEPPWQALPRSIPDSVRSLLRRCLRKDKRRRLRELSDARYELEEAHASLAFRPTRWMPGRMWTSAAAFTAIGAAAAVVVLSLLDTRATAPDAQVRRTTILLARGAEMNKPYWNSVALSPDATRLVYSADRIDGSFQLYLRPLNSLESTPIPGTESGGQPFFDPTGQWVGFSTASQMKKVSVQTGTVVTLCDVSGGRGGSWGDDNTIYFANRFAMWRVSAGGGVPERLGSVDRAKGEESLNNPQALPGGKALLIDVWTGWGWNDKRIEVLRLETGTRHVIVEGGSSPRYIPSGHIVYHRGATEELWAVRFDLDRLESIGQPVALGEHVRSLGILPEYSVSSSGALVYVPGAGGQERRLVLVDQENKIEVLQAPPRSYTDVRVSPDGRLAALQIVESTVQIFLYDFDRRTLTPLATSGTNQFPTWTLDGKAVVYTGLRRGLWTVLSKAIDGTGTEEALFVGDPETIPVPLDFTRDGTHLLFQIMDGRPETGGSDLWLWSMAERKRHPFLLSRYYECCASPSPDRRTLAYSSKRSGQYEVYATTFPRPGTERWPISRDGGVDPRWSSDGGTVFYFSGSKLMSAKVDTRVGFRSKLPELLFDYGFTETNAREYDIAPDGKRFLMLERSDAERPVTRLTFIQNWIEDVKRLVPPGGQ
jgi:serine/threonine-protein kinase